MAEDKNDNPLESISSLTSIGFDLDSDQSQQTTSNEQMKISRKRQQSFVPPEKFGSLFTVFENDLDNCFFNVPNDTISLLLICSQHNKIALQQLLNFYFFPSLIQFPDQSLNEQITSFVFNSLFPNEDETNWLRAQLIHIYRLRLGQKFITRLTFKIELFSKNDYTLVPCICKNNATVSKNNNDRLSFIWMPIAELSNVFHSVFGGELIQLFNNDKTFLQPILYELDDTILEPIYANLSFDVEFSVVKFLYNELMSHCFPSTTMSLSTFNLFCNKIGWLMGSWFKEDRIKLFRSFDSGLRGFLEVNNLIDWMDASQTNYDEKFQLKILFFNHILTKYKRKTLDSNAIQQLVNNNIYLGRCQCCLRATTDQLVQNRFSLSSTIVQISMSGNLKRLYRLRPSGESRSSITFISEFPERNIFALANEFILRIEKIDLLKSLNPNPTRQQIDSFRSFLFQDKTLAYYYIEYLLEFVKKLLENYSPIIDIQSPGFIIGNLYGSIKNLLKFSRSIFKTFPFFHSGFLLFLGNFFINTNDHLSMTSEEIHFDCFLYLLCMKILSPEKIWLLRNSLELDNDFIELAMDKAQCFKGLAEKKRNKIKRLILTIYKRLPVACIIDEQIFATDLLLNPIPLSTYRLKTIINLCLSSRPSNNIHRIFYNYEMIKQRKNKIQQEMDHKEINRKFLPLFENLLDDMIERLDDGHNTSFRSNQLLKFLLLNSLFLSISSNNPRIMESENNTIYATTGEGYDFGIEGDPIPANELLSTCIFLDQNIVRFVCVE